MLDIVMTLSQTIVSHQLTCHIVSWVHLPSVEDWKSGIHTVSGRCHTWL